MKIRTEGIMPDNPKPRSWLERISSSLTSEPRDRQELIEVLHDAEKSHVLNHEAMTMIEGVLQVTEMQVRDVMVPRSQMIVIHSNLPLEKIIPIIIESGHSRFPVVDDDMDNVHGMLLAKDLLRYRTTPEPPFLIKDSLRPVTFIPESKRLDSLLKEFRHKRNHMAMVVDEYGGVAGLITIEDVIEQIVGEIEDEYDAEDADSEFIEKINNHEYIINPILEIADFNEYFNTQLIDEQFDTIGGLVLHQFGHLPKPGEETNIDVYHFTVLHSDNRRIRSLKMEIRG